jgi:hypothetical protein
MLFQNGGKNFGICSKDVVICNPLTANLVFAASVEGPFSLHSAHDISKGGTADAKAARGNKMVTFDASTSEVSGRAPTGLGLDGSNSASQIGASILTTGKAFNLLPGVCI